MCYNKVSYGRNIFVKAIYQLLCHVGWRWCPESVGPDPHCLAWRVQKFSGCEGKTTLLGWIGANMANILHVHTKINLKEVFYMWKCLACTLFEVFSPHWNGKTNKSDYCLLLSPLYVWKQQNCALLLNITVTQSWTHLSRRTSRFRLCFFCPR